MNIFRGFTVLAFIAVLGACSDILHEFNEVEALNNTQPVGSPFTQKLTSEYRGFVAEQIDQDHDHADGLHFARKGLASARGDIVMPEAIADWNLLPGQIEELSVARGRLINVFNHGARDIAPDMSAIAQARFDCWIEQEEENWKGDNTAFCESQFANALANLENAVQAHVPPPAPEEPPVDTTFGVDPSQPMKAEDALYLVFFDFDRTNINTGAANVIDSVVQEVSSRNLTSINIVGHADTSGSKSYNRRLSMKRANAVRDALTQRGIDASTIRLDSRGEEELLVETADNVREPANRRAEISFQ